jgi:hypothetical protein
LAEFSPAATIVSNARSSAPPRRMAVSSTRANCSSVMVVFTDLGQHRQHLVRVPRRRWRRLSLHPVDLGGVLHLAQRLDDPGGGNALGLALEQLAPAPRRGPRHVLGLEADARGRRRHQRRLHRGALAVTVADGDLDTPAPRRRLDLFGRLGAVAAVGRQQRARWR